MLFLDTEFLTSARGDRLISLGLAGKGLEFYAELDGPSLRKIPGLQRRKFIAEEVLPQLGRMAGAACDINAMALRLAAWLDQHFPRRVEVGYDYSVDFHFLEQLLKLAGASATLDRLSPTHLGYLLEDPDGISAAERAWAATGHSRGVHRHHALADALALEARFLAVHGEGPPSMKELAPDAFPGIDELEGLAAKAGVSVETLRTFAGISDPRNAHLFSVEAGLAAFAESRQRSSRDESD